MYTKMVKLPDAIKNTKKLLKIIDVNEIFANKICIYGSGLW